jgi:hypothetical protein
MYSQVNLAGCNGDAACAIVMENIHATKTVSRLFFKKLFLEQISSFQNYLNYSIYFGE